MNLLEDLMSNIPTERKKKKKKKKARSKKKRKRTASSVLSILQQPDGKQQAILEHHKRLFGSPSSHLTPPQSTTIVAVDDEYCAFTASLLVPDELLHCIFSFVPCDSLLLCVMVNHQWNRVSRSADLWRDALEVSSEFVDRELVAATLKPLVISERWLNFSCSSVRIKYTELLHNGHSFVPSCRSFDSDQHLLALASLNRVVLLDVWKRKFRDWQFCVEPGEEVTSVQLRAQHLMIATRRHDSLKLSSTFTVVDIVRSEVIYAHSAKGLYDASRARIYHSKLLWCHLELSSNYRTRVVDLEQKQAIHEFRHQGAHAAFLDNAFVVLLEEEVGDVILKRDLKSGNVLSHEAVQGGACDKNVAHQHAIVWDGDSFAIACNYETHSSLRAFFSNGGMQEFSNCVPFLPDVRAGRVLCGRMDKRLCFLVGPNSIHMIHKLPTIEGATVEVNAESKFSLNQDWFLINQRGYISFHLLNSDEQTDDELRGAKKWPVRGSTLFRDNGSFDSDERYLITVEKKYVHVRDFHRLH